MDLNRARPVGNADFTPSIPPTIAEQLERLRQVGDQLAGLTQMSSRTATPSPAAVPATQPAEVTAAIGTGSAAGSSEPPHGLTVVAAPANPSRSRLHLGRRRRSAQTALSAVPPLPAE